MFMVFSLQQILRFPGWEVDSNPTVVFGVSDVIALDAGLDQPSLYGFDGFVGRCEVSADLIKCPVFACTNISISCPLLPINELIYRSLQTWDR